MAAPMAPGSGRLEAYSDAIFSIIATVMIVPIAHTKIDPEKPLGPLLVDVILIEVVVYIFCFLLVSKTWMAHVWLFEIIERSDEVVVLMNLALMMVVSFLPFTFTLLGLYLENRLAILLFCGSIVLVSVLQFLLVFHVFRNSQLLKDEVRLSASKEKLRNTMFARVITAGVVALCTAALVPISTVAANIGLLFLLFGDYLRKKVIELYQKCRAQGRDLLEISLEEEPGFRTRLLSSTVTKERIECFSDGVFAIVATLIILDICEENIPDPDMVKKHGSLHAALYEELPVFLTYAGTFVTVGLLWYIHHSLLHYLTRVNKLMVWFNQLCLVSVGLIVLGFKSTNVYTKHKDSSNEETSIQLNCTFICLAGLFQMGIWITALFYQDVYVHPRGHYGRGDHSYMTAKLAVYPVVSVFVYFLSTFAAYAVKVEAFVLMQLGIIVLFVLLRLLFGQLKRCFGDQSVPPTPEAVVTTRLGDVPHQGSFPNLLSRRIGNTSENI